MAHAAHAPRRPGRGALVAALLATAAARPARSAEAAPAPVPVSLTVAGGVSLGAYEAGLLQYTLAWLAANPDRLDVRLATGASAGSVNAVLAVLARCGGAPAAVEEGLFWRTWVPPGLSELYVEGDVSMRSAFSRRWMQRTAAEVEARWNAGLDPACDVVVGVSATRVAPRHMPLAGGAVQVPRVEEHFALRIQGRGPGRPPRLTNYVDADGAGDALLLPEAPGGEVPFAALRDLLFASAAVPLAFAPVELAYCAPERGQPRPRCPPEAVRTAAFIDGGIFDNSPLRLAAWLARAGLRADAAGRAAWLEASRARDARPLAGMRFAFVSPDVTSYPVHEEAFRLDATTPMLKLLGQEAQSFLVTARAKNLHALVEESPDVADHALVTARRFPAASSPMAAFFGFFEREFRRYDFYLGMYDARRALAGGGAWSTGAAAPPRLPEAASADPGWRPLACLAAIFEHPERPAEACAAEDLRDFRILAQTSLERLYQECAAAEGQEDAPPDQDCRAARGGAAPPRVAGVDTAPGADWRQAPGESEPAWVVRLLASHRFAFRDLGLDRDEGDQALRRIRLQLERVVWAVSSAQPVGEDIALRRAGQMAANAVAYVPPRNTMWLAFSRDAEIGWMHALNWLPGWAGSLHLHVALQSYGLYDLLSSEKRPWGLAPLLGVGSVVPPLSNAAFQSGVFVRAGWLFASDDDFGTGTCPNASSNVLGSCSRFTAQAGAYSVALESVRLQLMFEWFPGLQHDQGGFWNVSPALGVQLSF